MQNIDATFETIDIDNLQAVIGGAGWGETIGSWVGGVAGTVAGTAGGGFLGSAAGPVGTVAGAAAGGYVGGRAGQAGGEWLGRQVDNYFGGR